MGTALSSLLGTRKRSRSADDDEEVVMPNNVARGTCQLEGAPLGVCAATAAPSPLSSHLCALRYDCTSAEKVGSVVCRHVAEDTMTRESYGCHAHAYETRTAGESHGVALVWCVDEAAPLSPLALLSLCRVANTCRKKALLTSPHGRALILTYTATL